MTSPQSLLNRLRVARATLPKKAEALEMALSAWSHIQEKVSQEIALMKPQ